MEVSHTAAGIPEATDSPFTPDDSPVYQLCPDSPIQRKTSALKSVPEDTASLPAEAEILQPEALQLPTLRTPRKAPPSIPAPAAKLGSEQLAEKVRNTPSVNSNSQGLKGHLISYLYLIS